jgi:hypothetical protein
VTESLSADQRALVEASGELFVKACPGAGKTRAIVTRFVRRAGEERRKGVALLSFTNAAIDEARLRARAGATDVLRPPHYVGTFDGFINRFITGPIYSAASGKAPSYVEEWSELVAARIGAMQMAGAPLPLDCFTYDDAGSATLVVERVEESYGRRKQAVAQRPKLEELATKRFKSLVDGGTFACSASRWYATRALESPVTGPAVSRLLAARFSEVIVDEGQDCDERELAILRSLRSAGVRVVMVADFDQAIYEFRDARPDLVREFAGELPGGARLAGNFRSSPAICRLTASLRYGDETDNAVGCSRDCETPVLVVAYDNPIGLRERLASLAEASGEVAEQMVLIAHRRADARGAAGLAPLKGAGESSLGRLAQASLVLRSPSSGSREKERARARIERILLETREGVANGSLDQMCSAAEVPRNWLHTAAGRLGLGIDPIALGRFEYAGQVRQFVDMLAWPGPTKCKPLGGILKATNDKQWTVATASDSPGAFRADTIHSHKGREAVSVTVVLPKKLREDDDGRTALDRWEAGEDAEARRVLYVGASRAKRLLIIAVHNQHIDQLERILTRDEVPYKVSG